MLTRGSGARRGVALLCFLLSLLVFNANLRRIGAYDTLASGLLPFNLWQGNGLILDRFSTYPAEVGYSMVPSKTGHVVSFYPVVTPILVAPLYAPWAAAWFAGRAPDVGRSAPAMEKLSASVLAAASVALVFLLLNRVVSTRLALVLTAAYAIATPTWSISSQALWQHGTAELLLAASLLLLIDRERNPFRLALLGVLAGLITANRPVGVVFSIAIAALVVRRWRWRTAPFWVASASVAALWVSYNTRHFHSILGGYGDWKGANGASFWMMSNGLAGLAGLLASNRGLLTFCPFLLIFFLAPRAAVRKYDGLGFFLIAVLLYLYLSARTQDWAGGYSYGPRFATDILPVLILSIAAPLESVRSVPGRAALAGLFLYSVALQFIGAFYFPGGDSGNEDLGLWNVAHSSPVVALRAGLQTPYFAHLLAPSLVVRDRLPADGLAAAFDAVTSGPLDWRSREAHRIVVRVTNRSRRFWSSLGGLMGWGAVRLVAYWSGTDGGPSYTSPAYDSWLSVRVAPGESVLGSVYLPAPNASGRFRLNLELEQIGYGRFSERGVSAFSEVVDIAPGEETASAKAMAVEWSGGEGPREIVSGGEAVYRIGVRNLTGRPFSAATSVSYHWTRMDGPGALYEGERTLVSTREGTASPFLIRARVRANVPPGVYRLEFDMVDEGVAWFSNAGSSPLMLTVRVVPPAG